MAEFFFDNGSESSYSDEGQEPSLRVDPSEISSINKHMHKNKFVNKIRDMGAEERSSLQDVSVKSLDKKERNKVSGKLSRDRKKLYI